MVELSAISNMLETMLNANNHGILFDIKADRNEYDEAKKTTDQFTVPGVLTALSGNYEPLQGIKVYNMPINLELFGYAQIEGEIPSVPYTVEHQKECVGSVVESLNGSTQTIGNNAVIFSGFTITVGNVMNDAGGGYTRIPILVQLQLTIVEGAVFSNDVVIKIDDERVYANTMSIDYQIEAELQASPNLILAKGLPTTQRRSFAATFYLLSTSGALQSLKTQMLTGELVQHKLSVEKSRTLSEDETVIEFADFEVYAQQISEILSAGAIVQMSAIFIEQYPYEVNVYAGKSL